MRITHLEHSCLLVEAAGSRLLVDPGGFSTGFEDLRGLDAVLLTHQHPDHVDIGRLPPLLAANPRAAVLAEPETAAALDGVDGVTAAVLAAGGAAVVGGLTLAAVGCRHAVIHEDLPRVGNVGVLVTADGEPTLFVPGDAYDTAPAGVEVLALPLSAPWASLSDTVSFARAVSAPVVVPVHDGLLRPPGRAMYLARVGELVPRCTVRDLAGAGPVEI